MKVQLVTLDELPAEGSKIVSFFHKEVHVYLAGGAPRAVANVCLHLGGPLECIDGAFVCPWHGARFDMSTGEKTQGPAPKGARLMRLPTIVENGALFYVWGEV
ncbi:MAG: hypothetical protein JWS10_2370 [Cypionkella sp.]|uniref:Rieske (2Fe-2S) protein n=1 Tax=Cypionkella sp. TaxID=2811411 RepID=UPI002606E3F7|nr:Rieske 2Fe-2S domain-containing protein [Cypionkella sp.]MDB5659755.1 hypothetical protein [Cypionkella sp.]